ncbi:unnamed protein product [Schistosoma turkestanicum]|nr:unnamed protein product [Schistosoma turkestanicum]
MLPTPPACEKGAPSWSSLKRKSWLYPDSLDCARDNVHKYHLLKTNKATEHKPLLLPNCLSSSHAPSVRILTMKTLNTIENQFPLILYNNEMLREKCLSPINKLSHLSESTKVRKNSTSPNNIQLLKPALNYSAIPWETINNNVNKLLSLNKIKSIMKFNSKIAKNSKQNVTKLHLLKSHFLSNEYQLLKNSNVHQFNNSNRLLQLPYLCHAVEKKLDYNKTGNELFNNSLTSKETYLSNRKKPTDCKPTSHEHTLQMLTYPILSEQQYNNEDQPTLNDISWALETTKENIQPQSVNNVKDDYTSQCKLIPSNENEKKSYHDFGVQFNFVDYGEPKTQIGFNAFTNYENTAWPSDCVEQLLSNDIAHVTKQFLSIHTSDLIDWNNEDMKYIEPCIPLHIDSSNLCEHNNSNITTTNVNLQSRKQPMEMNNTISPSEISQNEALHVSKLQIQTLTTENKPESMADLVTAKKLQYSNTVNQENGQSMNNEIRSLLSYVVKALSEIDNRLNVIDQVSVQLEQDHKRNQELLETIIQLNKEQKQINSSNQLDKLNESELISQQQSLHDESNFKSDQLRNQKPLDSKINPNVQNQTHNCTTIKQQTKPPKPNQRSNSFSGHFADEREKLRKERREVSITRRCNEAKQFVNEILSENILPVQSSPRLTQSNITKPSNTPIRRGRSQTRNRGTLRVSSSRNFSKNNITSSNPKPPTPVRFNNNGRSGVTARGMCNVVGNKKQQTKIVQKPSVLTDLHLDAPKHLPSEDDLQTTILSDWSLESNVKRILYGDEDERFRSPSRQQSTGGVSNFDQESPIPQSPHSMPETDLFTEIGGVPSTSFIDWDEIDELIGEL